MATGLEGVAAKSWQDKKLVFTSLAHHISRDLIMESLKHIPLSLANGIDGIDVRPARDSFRQC